MITMYFGAWNEMEEKKIKWKKQGQEVETHCVPRRLRNHQDPVESWVP